eukprot:TRINITY_DN4389_c0_g2_i1.p1 TRINITY_DN4389_c0_g2~~TRINITY_DN4389_c0_g2_i1.p1  ORF type:complete len:203 (-),score=10.66 TRINITY_DN4389_c0_g2_i1:870-1478(-)
MNSKDASNLGVVSMWYKSDELDLFLNQVKFGDCVEFQRNLINHWAVYVGDKLSKEGDISVIHVHGDTFFGSHFSSTPHIPSSKSSVSVSPLADVILGSQFRINNELDLTEAPSSLSDMCVKITNELESSLMSYKLLSNNCEHFAKKVRNHKIESDQINKVKTFLYRLAKFGLFIVPLFPHFRGVHMSVKILYSLANLIFSFQ